MDFRDKIGPLAVWQWGLVVGGIAVAFMVRSWRSDSGDSTVYENYDSEGGLKKWAAQYEQMSGQVTPSPHTDDSDPEPAEPTIANNLLWLTQGVRFASEAGYSPLTSQIALQKYLSGGTLNSDEQRIVNAVIARLGVPPDGTDGTPTLPTPTPAKPAPTPTKPAPDPQASKRAAAIQTISKRIDAIKAERAALQNQRTKLKEQRKKETNKTRRAALLQTINQLAAQRAQLLAELRALQTQRAVLRAL